MEWYYWLIIGVGALIIIGLVIFLIKYISAVNKKKSTESVVNNYYNNIIEACGGIENIIEVSNLGSRLSFVLKYQSLFDDAKLKEINITGVFKTTKKITIVVGDKANDFAIEINKLLTK